VAELTGGNQQPQEYSRCFPVITLYGTNASVWEEGSRDIHRITQWTDAYPGTSPEEGHSALSEMREHTN